MNSHLKAKEVAIVMHWESLTQPTSRYIQPQFQGFFITSEHMYEHPVN